MVDTPCAENGRLVIALGLAQLEPISVCANATNETNAARIVNKDFLIITFFN